MTGAVIVRGLLVRFLTQTSRRWTSLSLVTMKQLQPATATEQIESRRPAQ